MNSCEAEPPMLPVSARPARGRARSDGRRAVRGAHRLVRLVERLAAGVERVGVLHDELAPAHQAETRTHLVAELRLDLIEVDRQLAVRVDRVAHGVGDDFLGRRRVDEVALVAVFDAQQLLAVALPAPRLHPQLGRLDRRHRAARPRRRGSSPRGRSLRASGSSGVRAAGRCRCRRQPYGSCRRTSVTS